MIDAALAVLRRIPGLVTDATVLAQYSTAPVERVGDTCVFDASSLDMRGLIAL